MDTLLAPRLSLGTRPGPLEETDLPWTPSLLETCVDGRLHRAESGTSAIHNDMPGEEPNLCEPWDEMQSEVIFSRGFRVFMAARDLGVRLASSGNIGTGGNDNGGFPDISIDPELRLRSLNLQA